MHQETRDERAQKKKRRKKKPANQHQQKEEKKGAIVVFVFICIERLLSLWRLESRLRWTTTTRYYSRKRAALFSERVSWRKRERICAFFSKGDVRFFFLEILNDCEKETAFEIWREQNIIGECPRSSRFQRATRKKKTERKRTTPCRPAGKVSFFLFLSLSLSLSRCAL